MGYVNVFVSSPCNLSVKNRQLIVKGQEEHSFPLEDMNALLIESAECNVSGYALQANKKSRKNLQIIISLLFCKKKEKCLLRKANSKKIL